MGLMDMLGYLNPTAYGNQRGIPLFGDAIGEVTGSNRAAAANRDALDRALAAQREGQTRGLSALDAGEAAGMRDLQPYMDMDISARRKYLQSWDQMSRPNLDAEYDQRWKDAQRDINAAGAKTGTYDSGAWRTATARAASGFQAQKQRDLTDFDMKRLQMLTGAFTNAGMTRAQLAASMGQSRAGVFTGGANAQANTLGQMGQNEAFAAMAPWQNLVQAAGAGAMVYGATRGKGP